MPPVLPNEKHVGAGAPTRPAERSSARSQNLPRQAVYNEIERWKEASYARPPGS